MGSIHGIKTTMEGCTPGRVSILAGGVGDDYMRATQNGQEFRFVGYTTPGEAEYFLELNGMLSPAAKWNYGLLTQRAIFAPMDKSVGCENCDGTDEYELPTIS